MSPNSIQEKLRQIGRFLDYHGLGHITFTQLTSGAFLTGYLLALGSSEFLIGVVAALPLFSKLSQLYISWQIERKGNWKKTTQVGGLWGRLPLLAAALLPLLGMPDQFAALSLMILVAISSLGGAIFEIGFLTWMAELVPVGRRGEFWGRRTRVAEFFGIVVALSAAFLFDQWREANPGGLEGYTILFLLGSISGVSVITFLRCIPSPQQEYHHVQKEPLLTMLKRPTEDKNFRSLLNFVGMWGFCAGLLGPFTTVYMLQELHLSFLPTTALNIIPSAIVATTQVYWGRLSDHFGCRPVLRVVSYLITIIPALWLASSVDRIWPIIVAQIISGFGWGGYNISMSNLVLKLAPTRNRSSYVASVGAVFATAQAIAPLCAGAMISLLKDHGSEPLTPYYILFATSFIVRAATTPLLGRVHEQGGVAVSHMIQVMGRVRSMSSSFAPDFLFDHVYTHLARIADFITREDGPRGKKKKRIKEARP